MSKSKKADTNPTASEATTEDSGSKKKNKNRKEKPWDTDGVDHWKSDGFKEGDMKGSLLEESSFATLFPRYKEHYLRDVWPEIQQALDAHGIACELNLVEGTMTVKTTRKTWDPYIIIKARDLIKLLSRSVPAPQAIKILGDDMSCDIIKINGIVRNKERFVKRRQRLLGPNGETLKALELLTNCYILVQGNTVSAMGTYKNLQLVRKIVTECMQNIHPIYHIKTLMIRRELEKDPQLANENWERFLPKFKKKNVKSKATAPDPKKEKKEYSPFPPAPAMSKIDLQIESGEFFLSSEQKRAREQEAKIQKSEERKKIRNEEYNKAFVPPQEPIKSDKKTPKTVETRSASDIAASLLQKTGTKRKREESKTEDEPKSKKQKTDRASGKKTRK